MFNSKEREKRVVIFHIEDDFLNAQGAKKFVAMEFFNESFHFYNFMHIINVIEIINLNQ